MDGIREIDVPGSERQIYIYIIKYLNQLNKSNLYHYQCLEQFVSQKKIN